MKVISTSKYYLETLWLLAKSFHNWKTLFIKLLLKKPINNLSLKNNFRFVSSLSNNLFEIVKEVWFENKYLPKNVFLDRNGVIVDIGANVGVFSVFASTLTRGKIVAVEPFSNNCKYLRKNLKNNSVTNVIIEQAAIAKKTGKRAFYFQNCDAGHGFYFAKESKSSQLVNTISFAGLIKKHSIKKIEMLKVDCEGAEGELFSSLPKNILNIINNISLEFHDNCSTLSHQQLISILQKAGFKTRVDWDRKSPFGYIYAN